MNLNYRFFRRYSHERKVCLKGNAYYWKGIMGLMIESYQAESLLAVLFMSDDFNAQFLAELQAHLLQFELLDLAGTC